MSAGETDRYARQVMLFGRDGQERLDHAHIFIAGAGGLGCPIALYLAAAGIGTITIVDNDIVELTNLNRQVLHYEKDVGRRKIDSVREKLAAFNSQIKVNALSTTIDQANAADLVGDADLIIDALDNFETRYVLNQVAIEKGIPFIHGAISGFDGQATVLIPGKTPCLRCLFPKAPPKVVFPAVGTTPGLIGMIQANEAIKYLTGTGELLAGRLLILDGLRGTTDSIEIVRDEACTACREMK